MEMDLDFTAFTVEMIRFVLLMAYISAAVFLIVGYLYKKEKSFLLLASGVIVTNIFPSFYQELENGQLSTAELPLAELIKVFFAIIFSAGTWCLVRSYKNGSL